MEVLRVRKMALVKPTRNIPTAATSSPVARERTRRLTPQPTMLTRSQAPFRLRPPMPATTREPAKAPTPETVISMPRATASISRASTTKAGMRNWKGMPRTTAAMAVMSSETMIGRART